LPLFAIAHSNTNRTEAGGEVQKTTHRSSSKHKSRGQRGEEELRYQMREREEGGREGSMVTTDYRQGKEYKANFWSRAGEGSRRRNGERGGSIVASLGRLLRESGHEMSELLLDGNPLLD
jgi:hypothetical protein